MQYTLIDLGYFSFYRYHALKRWWSFQKEKNQNDPWINEPEFRNKLIQKYEEYLNKLTKKKNAFLAMDAMDGLNWRKEVYPSYKAQRPKNTDIFMYLQYMFDTFIPNYSKNHPNIVVSKRKGTEADDLIAEKVFELKHNEPLADICIVANDMDYLQLVERDGNVSICDMNGKILSNKEVVGRDYLIQKIINGDSSDNIKAVYTGRKSGVRKKDLYEICKKIDNLNNISLDLFETSEAFDTFKMNRKLIEFTDHLCTN